MSEKCVHEWYYRIVDIVSWQFFCIRCGEKLSMDKFSDHASDLEKNANANANALTARIAELEAAQRWVPVSERLPEVGEMVLIAYKISRKTYIARARMNKEGMFRFTKNTKPVTHWMPLPEPPIVYGKVCEE